MEIKLVISEPKSGKSYQRIVKDADAKRFVGLKIGDKVKGEIANLAGYEFELTGGSDYAGFPMRKDVPGILRKKILAVSGIGFKKLGHGMKQRKTVAGNTVHEKTSQINLKILKAGSAPLAEEKPAEGEAKKEAKEGKKEEKPAKKEAK